jgi:hypothetical protein
MQFMARLRTIGDESPTAGHSPCGGPERTRLFYLDPADNEDQNTSSIDSWQPLPSRAKLARRNHLFARNEMIAERSLDHGL